MSTTYSKNQVGQHFDENYFYEYPTYIRFMFYLHIAIKIFTILVVAIPIVYLFTEDMNKDDANIPYFVYYFLRLIWTILSLYFFVTLLKQTKEKQFFEEAYSHHMCCPTGNILTKMYTSSIFGLTILTINFIIWVVSVVVGYVLYSKIYFETKDHNDYEGFKTAHLVQCIYTTTYYISFIAVQSTTDFCSNI